MHTHRTFDVVVVGSLSTDFMVVGAALPKAGETVMGSHFTSGPGGKGANQAVAVARLGGRVALVGRIGDDARGEALLQHLAHEGVDVHGVSRDSDRPTGAAVIGVDAQGAKQIMVAGGANLGLTAQDVGALARSIGRGKVLLVQLEVPCSAVAAALRLARAAGMYTVLDPAPACPLSDEVLALVDVLRPNAHEASALSGIEVTDGQSARRAARLLLDRGVGAVFCQAGNDGNLLMTQEETRWMAHLQVKSVDATGAGDACAAALAMALAEEHPVSVAAGWGHAAAALATTQLGAQAGLPDRHAVQALLGSTRSVDLSVP